MNNYTNYRGKGYPPRQNQQRVINKNFYNPYTFVPLTNKVLLLSKEEEAVLTHDVPFMGALSGTVSVDFEALTPFCVCQGDKNACVENQFFVPGTSIRGMIRNVFEIITMSNIKYGVADNRYSMRDLHNPSYELAKKSPPTSGFLFRYNGKFYIIECKKSKLSYSQISGITGSYIKDSNSVRDKYNQVRNYIKKEKDGRYSMWFFSGKMNNKKYEYLFSIPSFNDGIKARFIPLKEKEYEDFIFIHEKENENASWKFWRSKIKNYNSLEEIKADNYKGLVPCFFRTKTDANGELCVRDLGFSCLYRQPYQKSIHDFLPSVYHQDGIDMTQSVFGYTKGDNALKGRVQFVHSFIENVREGSPQTFTLGSPKPTYYPFYLKQSNPNKLNTYFDESTISGFKRYLIQQNAVRGNEQPQKFTKTFTPLPANTKFSSEINFHNLRDYELGALIAAVTFCNKEASCYHSLGVAKSFGYGKIKVDRCFLRLNIGKASAKDCYQAFIKKMCDKLGFSNEQEYLNSIAYLFEIASGSYNPQRGIRYPKMKEKEFDTIKKQRLSLKDFSPS